MFGLDPFEEGRAEVVDIVDVPHQPDVVEVVLYLFVDLAHSHDVVADVAAGR